ncbi:MAG: patatin-like phospholipase family protein [Gallionellaceae bacterium]|nr:patatin-like phospholipase family protein [Gallionellaceae bacterium]
MPDSTRSRLGLCLSGGGFRASLFHIGVLAALAEREMLHQVEVLSTVSGGSIIGAYYYLKVKQLLEGKRPGCTKPPTPEMYRMIVREIEVDFLAAVQKNIRLRLFSNPFKNALMAGANYSRSDRLAELLNLHFYDALTSQPGILLRDIFIDPEKDHVSASVYNESHPYKIPVLVINATSLNTGHTWHFTGAYVGEPPQRRGFMSEVDTNFRLPRLSLQDEYYYEKDVNKQDEQRKPLSEKQKHKLARITLADAVAASAAVPGVFPPLALHDLYETPDGGEIVIELSDGGVYDNQGVDALFHNECSHFVISDASGQLEDETILSDKLVKVMMRANDVMMNKIRNETLYRVHAGQIIASAQSTGPEKTPPNPGRELVLDNGLAAYALMHLRQEFPNSADYPFFPPPVDTPNGWVYRLSTLRTDLDSFSDTEAMALMYDGYCLAHAKLEVDFATLCKQRWHKDEGWRFLAMRDVLGNQEKLHDLLERLDVGRKQFFRVFSLQPIKAWAWVVLMAAILLPSVYFGVECYFGPWAELLKHPVRVEFTLSDAAIAIGLAIVAWIAGFERVQKWLKKSSVAPWMLPVGIAFAVVMLVAAAGFFLYRKLFDRLFLRDGSLPAKPQD